MTSITDSSVKIQTTSESNPSTPCWFGEVVLMSRYLQKHGILSKINEQVRFARKRFGRYDVIDFLAVLFGYAISGERTLEAFYERLQPFASPFMALFERDRLPSRSALSRFLAALCESPVEALRTLFLDDLLSRPLTPGNQTGGLTDRTGGTWMVFDVDGTREAARQRAVPRGTASGALCHHAVSHCVPVPPGVCFGAAGRPIRPGSRGRGSRWLRLCDPRQRVHRAGPPAGSGAFALASRSDATAPGKSDGSPSLRLPRRASGTRGGILPRGGGNASS